MNNPIYLGDGVYAHLDSGSIVLTTGHHEPSKADNAVYLEPDVLKKLLEYIAVIEKAASER